MGRICFTLLYLVTAYVVCGRLLVPLAGKYSEQLEDSIQLMIGHRVSVGSLEGRWRGFSPYLSFQDLVLYVQPPPDGTGASAPVNEYGLHSLSLSLDVPRSLFNWQWVIGEVTVNDLSLRVREDADGKWSVDGFGSGDGDGNYTDVVIDLLLNIERLQLSNASLTLQNAQGQELYFNNVTATLANDEGVHELQAEIHFANQQTPLQLVVTTFSDPRLRIDGSVYLAFDDLDFLPVTQFLADKLPATPSVLQGSGKFWLRHYEQSFPILQAELSDVDAEVEKESSPLINIRRFSGQMSALRNTENEWQGWLQDMALDTADQSWTARQYFARYLPGDSAGSSKEPGTLHLQADTVDLALLSSLLQVSGVLPEVANEVLAVLSPRGILRDLRLDTPLDPGALDNLSMQANVQGIGVEAYAGAPAVSGINGFLNVAGNKGQVEFDSPDLEVHLPRLFDQAWRYDDSNGRVGWEFTDQMLRVKSNALQISNATMSGQVKFEFLRQQDSAGEMTSDLSLLIGIDQMQAAAKAPYLPTLERIANTMNWLTDSVQVGQIYDSGLIYRGSTLRNAIGATQSTQAVFRVRDAELQFLPEWPKLEQVDATVLVSNQDVDVLSPAAETADIDLSDIVAKVRANPEAPGTLLAISGQGKATTEAGLNFLKTSPAGNTMRNTLESWQGQGDLDINLDLLIPLGSGNSGQKEEVSVLVTSHDSTLSMPELGLEFTGLEGDVSFESATGLQSEHLEGTLFDYPLDVAIETFAMNSRGEKATRIKASGRASRDNLAQWSLQPEFIRNLLDYAVGETGIEATLTLANQASGSHNSLRLALDMQDMALELPRPLNKPAGTPWPIDIQLDFLPGGDVIQVVYEHVLTTHLEMSDKKLHRGQVLLGSAMQFLDDDGNPLMGELAPSGLTIQGDVPYFDFEKWRAVADTFLSGAEVETEDETAQAITEETAEETVKAPPTPIGELINKVEVTVGTLHIMGRDLENVLLRAEPDAQGWQLYVDNDQVRGDLYFPEDASQVTHIDLDYLRLPSRSQPEDGSPPVEPVDPFEGVNPATLPRLSFHVDELTMNDANVGIWEFTLEPAQNGASIPEFRITMPDALIGGLESDEPASMFWNYQNGRHSTDFSGRFQAEDLAEVLPRLGLAALVESTSALLTGELTWNGTPAFFSLKRATGNLTIDLEDGRFVAINTGGARLLGALNVDSLVRRLQLDFSDLYQSGFTYDDIEGKVILTDGVVQTDGPFRIAGPSSRLTLNGQLDLVKATISADMLVNIPLGQNIAVLATLLGAWPIAVSTYLASRIFEQEMEGFTSVLYHLEGPLDKLQAGFSPTGSDPELAEDLVVPIPDEPAEATP